MKVKYNHNKLQITNYKFQNKGFSLIEIIVAIGIITVGLITIISLFNQNIKSEIRNKNKLIAIYLANESIEIVRQQRDNTWFGGTATTWMDDIPTGDVIVSVKNKNNIRKGWNIVTPGSNERKKVYLSDDDYYVQFNGGSGSWTETGFERYLTINTGTAGCLGVPVADCMQITSHVSFNGDTLVEVTAYLYDKWN